MPGMPRCPVHLNSLPGLKSSTFGLRLMPFMPGGIICTLIFWPSAAGPAIEVMNGFHSGYSVKLLSTAHTFSGEALMWMSVLIDFAIFIVFNGTKILQPLTITLDICQEIIKCLCDLSQFLLLCSVSAAYPAEGFGRHSQHGGNVLQRYLVEEFLVLREKGLVSFLGAHGKVPENAIFKHGETFGNK